MKREMMKKCEVSSLVEYLDNVLQQVGSEEVKRIIDLWAERFRLLYLMSLGVKGGESSWLDSVRERICEIESEVRGSKVWELCLGRYGEGVDDRRFSAFLGMLRDRLMFLEGLNSKNLCVELEDGDVGVKDEMKGDLLGKRESVEVSAVVKRKKRKRKRVSDSRLSELFKDFDEVRVEILSKCFVFGGRKVISRKALGYVLGVSAEVVKNRIEVLMGDEKCFVRVKRGTCDYVCYDVDWLLGWLGSRWEDVLQALDDGVKRVRVWRRTLFLETFCKEFVKRLEKNMNIVLASMGVPLRVRCFLERY